VTRAGLGPIVFMALLASAATPGSVGSCGRDALNESADFDTYCQQRAELECTRRFLRKEITAVTRDDCRWKGIDRCSVSSFPADCRPTLRVTQACLNALASFDTLATKEPDIAECKPNLLCTASPVAASDAGVENP
jgi:hypothetical protein